MTSMAANLFDLTGRVAVVTGSAARGGIGHALALGLAQQGASVVSADVDGSLARETAEEIIAAGHKSTCVECDIANPASVEALFAEVDRTFGRLDILVNNAGIGSHTHPEDLTLEEWHKVMEVDATGTFLCAQQAARRMIREGTGGSIINIASIAGSTALGRGNFVYSVAKGAVIQMTRELAVEWACHGIRVNAIQPAQIRTRALQALIDNPQFNSQKLIDRFLAGIPLNRLGEPEDLVGPVIFLASDAARFVTGVMLPVDGGNLALNAGGSHTWPKD
jgi:NAD(P)-dependent dehydrogenase (short-subunit alcohol dehydrogenase family)